MKFGSNGKQGVLSPLTPALVSQAAKPTLKARARLLFVAHTAEIGGPTYSLLMLVRYLRDSYEVAVLLPETGALSELLAGEGIDHFILPGLQAKTIHQIFQLIRREGFDLVYGNNPYNSSRNALIAAKLAGKPFIWHFRGMKWHWNWQKGIFLRGADAVVAVSRTCAESLQRFYPLEKIKVVYNGVEVSSFEGNSGAARSYLAEQVGLSPEARYPLREANRYLISVSHLTPRKGHEQAVAVMAQVVEEMPHVHLVVAGSLDRSAGYTEEIRALIRQQGLEDRIHLLGLRTDIPQLLAGSDVFLHTAKLDPHPRSVIEAMAAGLPVVAFGVDGVAETVLDRQTGYLLPLGRTQGMARAVLSLLQNPAQAARMGQLGRQRVENCFTAGGTAAQIRQIIEELL